MATKTIDRTRAKILAAAQLDHIRLFLESNDPDLSLLRSFATNWFGYVKGQPFVKKTGRVRWLNKLHPVTDAGLLQACHFHSVEASKQIGAYGEKGELVVDHAIPFACLRTRLQEGPHTNDRIQSELEEHLRLSVITRLENKRLNELKLRSALPAGKVHATARYEAAAIPLIVP